jgi:hypothetical protein
MTTSCGVGNECDDAVRYRADDIVGNTETPVESGFRARIDQKGPPSGTFSVTASSQTCSFSVGTVTDTGVGNSTGNDTYDIRWQVGSDPGACPSGTSHWSSDNPATVTDHTSLANGTTYYYRLCYKDALNNQSEYTSNPVTCTPVATEATDGAAPTSNKFDNGGGTNLAVGTFRITVTTGGPNDTVDSITVSRGGTGLLDSDVTAVRIYEDTGATPNEYDIGEPQIGGDQPFSGGLATFNNGGSGLSETVSTTSRNFIITYDIKAPPSANGTLQGNVSAITTTTNETNVTDTADGTITVDIVDPTTLASANDGGQYTFGDWTAATAVTVTLTPSDTGGSGLASTEYCIDTTTGCAPGTTYSVPFGVNCAAGSTCTQYVGYRSTDNAGNVEATNEDIVNQDLEGPTDGATFTATPNVGQCSLSWDPASDAGSGVDTTESYKVVFTIAPTAAPTPSDCGILTDITGTSTATGYLHTSLTDGETYQYRVCAVDASGNRSTGLTGICVPGDTSPPTINTDITIDDTTKYSVGTNYVAGATGYDYWAKFNDAESAVTCDYCASEDGTCDTEWTSGTITNEGAGVYRCDVTNVTCSTGDANLTLEIRGFSGGGTLGPVNTSQITTLKCDNSTPTTTILNAGDGSWTGSDVTGIELSPSDTFSGTSGDNAVTKYCEDDVSNDCDPFTVGSTYSVPFDVICGAGSLCDRYVRYASKDAAGNSETTNAQQVRIDKEPPPTDVSNVDASPGNMQCTISWTAADDGSGSGLHLTAAYRISRADGQTPPSNCNTWVTTTTTLSVNDTGLTNDNDYSYRVCAVDNVTGGDVPLSHCTPSEIDLIAPDAVSDLTIMQNYGRGMLLRWTAPYDDAGDTTSGAASFYDVRFSDAVDYPTTMTDSVNTWDVTNWDSGTYWGGDPLRKGAFEPTPIDPAEGSTFQFFTVSCSQPSSGKPSTTLSGNIAELPVTINVLSTNGFPTSGKIKIDDEIIQYTGITVGPDSFTGATRGADGTTAASHSDGATVVIYPDICISPGDADDRMLPNTLYYFSIRSKDEFDNQEDCQSGSANCALSSNVPAWDNPIGTTRQSHTALRYGWNMISLPYQWGSAAGGKNLINLFGDDVTGPNVYRWDSDGLGDTNGNWVSVSNTTDLNAHPDLEDGKGYYLFSYTTSDVLDERDKNDVGDPVLVSEHPGPVIVPLEPGRNLIGNPYLKNVRLYDSTKTADQQQVYICVSNGGTVTGYVGNACTGSGTLTRKTFQEAVADAHPPGNGWVDNAISFFVNETTPSAEPFGSAKLRPWWGVWLVVNEDPWIDSTDGAGLGSAPSDPDNKVMLIIIKP